MIEIVNKFLLTGDKFMTEMHLRQPSLLDKLGFVYNACAHLLRTKREYKKFKETRDSQHIYQSELGKACFNMTWLMEILKI